MPLPDEVSAMRLVIQGIVDKLLVFFHFRNERIKDDDILQMHSWHISASLASLSADVLENLPDEIACLVREAKELHQSMDRDKPGPG